MRLGLDLGGTKIEAILLDADGTELRRSRIPSPQGDYEKTLATIEQLVNDFEAAAGQRCRVGIGTPGSTSPASGLLRNSNSTWLNGRPFHQDLSARLDRQLFMENDANCFALSEATDGAGQGAETVFGVILGTGVGGGLVAHGRLLGGANAVAGEWGHNPLPHPTADELPGNRCYCERTGCIETWLSGPALLREYRAAGGLADDVQTMMQHLDSEPAAQTVFDRYADRLARSLASVINLFDPDVIVLGGGLSNITQLYADVPQRWGQWIFSDVVNTRLLPPKHGDSSGVRGAAWLGGGL